MRPSIHYRFIDDEIEDLPGNFALSAHGEMTFDQVPQKGDLVSFASLDRGIRFVVAQRELAIASTGNLQAVHLYLERLNPTRRPATKKVA